MFNLFHNIATYLNTREEFVVFYRVMKMATYFLPTIYALSLPFSAWVVLGLVVSQAVWSLVCMSIMAKLPSYL